jgi:hypothetical protein
MRAEVRVVDEAHLDLRREIFRYGRPQQPQAESVLQRVICVEADVRGLEIRARSGGRRKAVHCAAAVRGQTSTRVERREEALGRPPLPSGDELLPKLLRFHAREANQHPVVSPVVRRDEEGRGVGLHESLARVPVSADDERDAVLLDPREELASHAEAGGAVARSFLDAR